GCGARYRRACAALAFFALEELESGRAVGNAELPQQQADMPPDRDGRYIQAVGDLRRRETPAEQVEHFRLAPAQVDRWTTGQPQPAALVTRAELLEHGSEQRPRKRRFPAECAVQRPAEGFGTHVLLQVAGCSSPNGLEELALVRFVREHHNLGVTHPPADPPGYSNAPAAEIRVDQAQRRPLAQCTSQRRACVCCLRANLEAVLLKQQPDSLACGQLRLC